MKKTIVLLISLLLCLCPGCALASAEASGYDITGCLGTAQAVVSQHIQELRDNYSYYFGQEEYELMFDEYQGEFGGVGVSMIDNDQEEVVVYGLIRGAPAARDGRIQPGDVILAVNGTSLDGLDSALAALRIRGEAGEAVTLTLRRENSAETYDVTLVREMIHSESVAGERIEEAPGTAYICVYDFNEQTADDFVNLYNELLAKGEISTLVIDLRSNGGGSFFAAINIANYFIPQGEVIVSEKTSQGMKDYTSASGQLQDVRLYVLINGWSASASEVLAGALKDNAGATLVGVRSYGKGITQGLIRLDSGAGLRYTRSRYYTPSGYDLHGLGLSPDIPVADPEGITSSQYFSYDPTENPHLQAVINDIQTTGR